MNSSLHISLAGELSLDKEVPLMDILEEEPQSTVPTEEEVRNSERSPRYDECRFNRRKCDAPEIPGTLAKKRKAPTASNSPDQLVPITARKSARLLMPDVAGRQLSKEIIRSDFSAAVHVRDVIQEYQVLFGDQFPMTLPLNFNEFLWEANPSPNNALLALNISIAGALSAREMRQFNFADELYFKARNFASTIFDESAARAYYWLSLYAFSSGDLQRAAFFSALSRRMAEETGNLGSWAYCHAMLLEGHLSLNEQFRLRRLQEARAIPNPTTRMKIQVPLYEAYHETLSLRSTAGEVPGEKLRKIRELCRLVHCLLESEPVPPPEDPILFFGELILLLLDMFVAWLRGKYAKAQDMWVKFLHKTNRVDLGGHHIFLPFTVALLVHIAQWMHIPMGGRESLPFILQQTVDRYPLAQRVLASSDHVRVPSPVAICQPERRTEPQFERGKEMPVPARLGPKPDITIRLCPRTVPAPIPLPSQSLSLSECSPSN
jgi:hypothetical protein